MQSSEKSPDEIANDAKEVGRDAADKAKGVAADAMKVANDAVASGKAYVQDALGGAGKKFGEVRSQVTQTTDCLVKAINDEPVKAVLVTAAVSSLITAFFLTALRDRD